MDSLKNQGQFVENLEPHIFNSNEPILLKDPETVWLIESGSVSLFAVTVKDGITRENRRYLFNCEAGAALFGTIPNPNSTDYQMLAIPMGKVTLLKLDRELLGQSLTDESSNLTTLIDGWLKHFDTALFSSLVPKFFFKCNG